MDRLSVVQNRIISDMSEGVVYVRMDGIIESVNPAACNFLGFKKEELLGKPFGSVFFECRENELFNHTVLDALHDDGGDHSRIIAYFDGKETKRVFIKTSFMKLDDEKLGVIVVLNDIGDLIELHDAVETIDRIKELNEQLEVRNKLIYETFGR